MNSLVNNSQIKHFLLGNNIINTTGARAIANYINDPNKKSHIETWYLAGNCINDEGITLIAKALETDTDMKHLWLKRNPLNANGMKALGNMLKKHNNIEILDLHNTAVFDEGIIYLVEGLKENKSLRHLYLDANGITAKGIEPLANYFKERKEKGITSLWVSMNRLDDEGACLLLDSLKEYPYLKRLNIGSNGLTHVTAKKVYECFKDSKSLIMLNIGMYKSTADLETITNKLEDKGIEYIAKLIDENKSVKVLDVIHNAVTNVGIEKLSNAITKNNTLLYFQYVQYGLTIPSNINQIIIKLTENRKVANITENSNKFNERFLKHSHKIRYIDSIYRNNMK